MTDAPLPPHAVQSLAADPIVASAPTAAAAADAPIDPAVVDSLRRLGLRSGRDVLRELTDLFLSTADAQVATARQLLDCGNLAELARVAHALKGSGSVIGGRRVAAAAAALEVASAPHDGSSGNLRYAREAFTSFLGELELFREAVRRLHSSP